MRKTKALVALGFMLLVTPMVMGTVSLGIMVKANPGNVPQQLQGTGGWSLDPKDNFGSINFRTTLKNSNPPQTNFANANVIGNAYTSTLGVSVGTYNPSMSMMLYTDANMMSVHLRGLEVR